METVSRDLSIICSEDIEDIARVLITGQQRIESQVQRRA
jgi:hypothetical protein